MIWGGWTMDRLEVRRIHPASIPGLVPTFLGMALLACSALLLVRGMRSRRGGFGDVLPGRQAGVQIGLALATTLAYALVLIGNLPFAVATGLFVLVFIVVFGWEQGRDRKALLLHLAAAAIQAVLVAAIVTVIFERLFLVRLP
jgi:putative tricarboxylic transport membrane protein